MSHPFLILIGLWHWRASWSTSHLVFDRYSTAIVNQDHNSVTERISIFLCTTLYSLHLMWDNRVPVVISMDTWPSHSCVSLPRNICKLATVCDVFVFCSIRISPDLHQIHVDTGGNPLLKGGGYSKKGGLTPVCDMNCCLEIHFRFFASYHSDLSFLHK